MPHFSQSNHRACSAALADGRVLFLLLPGGPVAITELGRHDPVEIVGTDADGSMVFVYADSVQGWLLTPKEALDPVGERLEPVVPASEPSLGPEADPAYMEAYQNAFMALRAACDQSNDPAVVDAVANLEAVELMAGGDNDGQV